MDIISRKEAKLQKLQFYFTGVPCKNGHIDQRRTKNATCNSCAKETIQKFRLENEEHVKQHWKDYYKKHKDQILQQKYERERSTGWSEAKLYMKKRLKSTPLPSQTNGRPVARMALHRARKLNRLPVWVTQSHIDEMKLLYEESFTMSEHKPFEVDHIVPLQGNDMCGLHVPWNLQIVPRRINRQKKNK